SSTSESEFGCGIEMAGVRAELGGRATNPSPPPVPASASSFERGIILFIALYASIKVVRIMAANEVGRIEGLAAAKLVDIQRSTNFGEDSNIGMKDDFLV
ncbi:11668_t:CDS:2, partial [Acaulospora colombiana]